MRFKGWLFALLTLVFLPLGYAATVSKDMMPEAPNLEQLMQKHADFNFLFLVNEAVIKAKDDHFVLQVPKTAHNYQFIYQSTAPEQIVGTLSAEQMANYWKPGMTFAKNPPTVLIVSVDKRNNITYAVNFTSMTDDGKNLVFDMKPLPGKNQDIKPGKLHGLVIKIDNVGGDTGF